MALLKAITLDNGIITGYHRIVSINKITNVQNIIEVASYLDAQKREEEKNGLIDRENVFISKRYISKEYDENETIEDVYEFLKNNKNEAFLDAENDVAYDEALAEEQEAEKGIVNEKSVQGKVRE